MAPRNPDDFDGYRKWLGISDKKRPPTHYELLSISLNEDDHEVISAAAEQRRKFVESKRNQGHDSVVTEILYRISEAETTLLNEDMRRDYDRQLNLFEKRRKNRQVDPFASPSAVKSQSGRSVGEDTGIVKMFAGIMAVVVIGFGVMAWLSFQLPWKKPVHQVELAVAPAAPVPVAAPPAQIVQVPAPVAVAEQPAQVQVPEPVKPVVEQVVKNVPAEPEIINVEEINTENGEFSPWLSENGLTIYWDSNDRDEAWIWTAARTDKNSLFGGKTKLFRGRFPLVSTDGLEIIFKSPDFDGFSVATRKATSDSFGRPRRISELKVDGLYANPRCLSHDGLSLYFDRDKVNGAGKGNDTWVTTRRDRSSQWQKPTQLAIDVSEFPKTARFTQVCLTKDELHLFGLAALPKAGGKEDIRPGMLSRKSADGPFTKYQPLTLRAGSSEPLPWAVPRYVESTNEMFILSNAYFRDPALGAKRKLDIWIVKKMDIPAQIKDVETEKQ